VAVAGGRIYTAGTLDRETYVTALDLEGKVVWQRRNGRSWEATQRQPWAVPYAGSRGTPTVDESTIYHLAEMGSLRAFDAESGEERWHVELLPAFAADRPKYGLSESVFVHGDALLCCPGGKKGYMVALNKHDGRTLWTNTEIEDPVGYCSPVLARIDGVQQVVTMSADRVFAVKPDDGSLLWTYEFGNHRNNSATDVIVHENLVYASCGYGKGSVLLRPKRQAGGRFEVEPVWTTSLLDNHHGGVLRVGDHLYGAGHQARGWFCLDFKTGRQLWQKPGKGTLTFADGRLYCVDERGTLSLVRCTPEKWDAASSFSLPRGGMGLYWAHPVVCGGRLYVRHAKQLFAYRVRS
jgi:outer membrane protein assembly factor BamB